MQAKYIVITILVLVLLGAVGYLFMNSTTESTDNLPPETTEVSIPVEPDGGIGDGAEPLDEMVDNDETTTTRGNKSTLGTSVNGAEIIAYHLGTGAKEVLLVGGVHGGYSPNTSSLARELVDHFTENPNAIPENITLTIIPTLNPDGLSRGGTLGRFNANDVDLNRNFDCEWKSEGVWQDKTVSGGSAPFSEPEAAALRDYVEAYTPAAAVVWFSAEGKVYPSACGGAPSTESVELAATFATAAGYPAEAEFDAYAITGDMVNWMAKENIPAISVLLTNHETMELEKNVAGVEAILNAPARN